MPDWFKPDQSHIERPEKPAFIHLSQIQVDYAIKFSGSLLKHLGQVPGHATIRRKQVYINESDIKTLRAYEKLDEEFFFYEEKLKLDRMIQWHRYYREQVLDSSDDPLLEQFALKAPPAPDWFEPKMNPLPEAPEMPEILKENYNMYTGAITRASKGSVPEQIMGGPEGINEALEDYRRKSMEHIEFRHKWFVEQDKQATIQWPWAYAKMVIDGKAQIKK